MKHCLLFLSLYLMSIAVFSESDEPEERLVFIGTQLEFSEIDYSDEDDDCVEPDIPTESDGNGHLLDCEVTIRMDSGFNATYSVIKILEGSYLGNTVKFEVYDHYGIPAFSKFNTAMIYLRKYDGQWFHQKYTWNKVYKTTDGKYADCSLAYTDFEEDQRSVLKPVKFETPVIFDIGHLNKDLQRKYKSDPIYLEKDNIVTCQKGIYAKDLLAMERE